MKLSSRARVRLSNVGVFALLWLCPLAAQQKSGRDPADPLIGIANATIEAIKNGNADFLSAIADPGGVFIGIDGPKISRNRFIQQLSEKRGVYCAIFDSSCLDRKALSLREILAREAVMVEFSKIQGARDQRAVVLKSKVDPTKILFTIMFSTGGKAWKLQQIEYW